MCSTTKKLKMEFKREMNGSEVRFEIGIVDEPHWSTAVEFMLGNYIREDVWWVAAGTASNEDAIQEYRVLLTSIVRLGMSLGCYLIKDGTQTLVGVNMIMPQIKDHFVEHVPPKSDPGMMSLRMFSEAMKITEIYNLYNVNEYLMGTGLSVLPEYRGLGIAVEMLRARMQLTKEIGFTVTGGIFTSGKGQRSAELAGMTCYHQILYEDFGKRCQVTFVTDTEFLKYYAVRVTD